jgi:alkanesulfonate monooxygenase SsuD/methylene tetrahydromethanopterin reductase-like flavin-dependent oxidoreductase (luciferase family)
LIERFGVTVDWRGATIDGVTAIAKQADESGYGHLFIPEAWGLEAFSTIGYLLSITKRIKIATGVVNVFSRSAATIAMSCATLNQLAPGRFILGIGVSGRGVIESWHGLEFKIPLQRTREYVDVIKAILRGDVANYNGRVLKLERFRLFTTPPSQEIEILLGAIGEKNLRVAGEIADGAILALYPISKLRETLAIMNELSDESSKRVFSYLPFRITHSRVEFDSSRLELSRYLSFYISSMGEYYHSNLSKLGYGEEVEKIRTTAANSGSKEAASSITPEFLDDLTLIGSPSDILRKVSAMSKETIPVLGVKGASIKDGIESAKMLDELAKASG